MRRHNIDKAIAGLEPIDRDRLLSTWSDSEAKRALFQEITTMPAKSPAPSSRIALGRAPKRRLVTIAVAVGATVLTGTLAIAAGGFNTENTPGAPEETMGQFVETVEPYRDAFEFAPHRSFDEAVAAIDAASDDDQTSMAVEGMTDMVGFAALCSWLDYWRTATIDGDENAAATAIQSVEAAREWPWALVNTTFVGDRYMAAMRAGDVTYVTWELGLNCLPAMTEVPAIPPTGPVPDGIEQPTEFYGD